MTSTNSAKNSDQSSDQSIEDFSWDALPEVAKERWEEMVAYSSTVENQLSKAKASRAQAETERQRIASETLKATKDACRAVVADSKRAITKLKNQATESEANYAESRRQLDQALSIRNEADTYRESALASAEKQAQEIFRTATHAAEVDCARLKKQASLEAYQLLAQAEAMRTAAQEELEAQKIYTEAAILKADAHEALGQLQARLDDTEDPLEDVILAGALEGSPGNGLAANLEDSQETETETVDGVAVNPSDPDSPTEAGAVATAGETPSSVDPVPGDAQPSPNHQERSTSAHSKPGAKGNRAKAA